MSRVSPYLHCVQTKGGSIGYGHYCPGCFGIHIIWTTATEGGPTWAFNNDVNKPSFSPSLRHFRPKHTDGHGKEHAEYTICHYHITDGELRYCGDSAHALKGQTVPLPQLPARYSDEQYGWPGA